MASPVQTIKQETIAITLTDGKGTILVTRKGKDYKTVGVLSEFVYTANGIMQILDAIAATRLAVVAQQDAAAEKARQHSGATTTAANRATAAAATAAAKLAPEEPAAEEPATEEPAAAEEETEEPAEEEPTEEEPDAPNAANDQGTLF